MGRRAPEAMVSGTKLIHVSLQEVSRGNGAMCDKCDELDEKIALAKRLSHPFLDRITLDRIAGLLEQYERDRKALHPEQND